jgi:hypothetical protein
MPLTRIYLTHRQPVHLIVKSQLYVSSLTLFKSHSFLKQAGVLTFIKRERELQPKGYKELTWTGTGQKHDRNP